MTAQRHVALVLIILAGVLFSASEASAAGWTTPPRSDEARVTAYLPIARAAWPDSPCNGREDIRLRADRILDTVPDVKTGFTVMGYAPRDSCTMLLRAGMTAHEFCLILTHEAGHQAGLAHTEIGRGGIMDPSYPSHAPCDVARPPSPAIGATTDALPDTGPSWTIRCTRRAGAYRTHVCWARRPGARVRRYDVEVRGFDRTATFDRYVKGGNAAT